MGVEGLCVNGHQTLDIGIGFAIFLIAFCHKKSYCSGLDYIINLYKLNTYC